MTEMKNSPPPPCPTIEWTARFNNAFLKREADAKRGSWSRPQSALLDDIATQIARGDDMRGDQ